jgi:hypothetical protein
VVARQVGRIHVHHLYRQVDSFTGRIGILFFEDIFFTQNRDIIQDSQMATAVTINEDGPAEKYFLVGPQI